MSPVVTDYERRRHLAAWEHACKRLMENRRERRKLAMARSVCFGLAFGCLGLLLGTSWDVFWATLPLQILFGFVAGACQHLINLLNKVDRDWRANRDWHGERMYGDPK